MADSVAAGGQSQFAEDGDSDSSLEFQIIAAADGDSDEYVSEDSEASLDEIEAYSASDETGIDDSFLRSILRDQCCLEQTFLNFQHVDFLSDFGSNEPFLIDGDALVVSALDDTWLDWKNGGQFLHLVYIVECFLQKLCDRGCQFDIFFMLGNENLLGHESSSLLARTILIHHLKSTRFSKVHLLSGSWLQCDSGGGDASTLRELLNDFRPSFIMTNSGWQGKCERKRFVVAQMHFAHHCLAEGKIVITFEHLTFEGSRVFGFVYLPPGPVPCAALQEFYGKVSAKLRNFLPLAPAQRSAFDHTVIRGRDLRETLYLKALCLVVSESSLPPTRGFAMLSIACVVMTQRLSLNERAFVLPNPGHCALAELSELSDAVRVFEEKLFSALTESLQQAVAAGITIDPSVADIFDGRLFSFVVLQLAARWSMPAWVDELCFQQFTSSSINGESLVFKIKHSDVVLFAEPGQSGDKSWWSAAERLLSIEDEERACAQALLANAQQLRSRKTSLRQAQLRKVGEGEMLSEVLGNVSERMKEFEVECRDEDLPSAGPFSPHHYHSTRPLDEPDSFAYTFDKREFSFHSQESLQRRLEEIEDQFEKGRIIPFVRAKMQELERLLSQGRLSRGFFELLKKELLRRNDGFITDRDYEAVLRKILARMEHRREANELKQEQKRAKAERAYLESLLQGSPVREMTIAEKLTESEIGDRRVKAQAKLFGTPGAEDVESASPETCLAIAKSGTLSSDQKVHDLSRILRSLDPTSDKKLLDCFREKGGWRGRGPTADFKETPDWAFVIKKLEKLEVGKSEKKGRDALQGNAGSRAEAIRKENEQRIKSEKMRRDEIQLENLMQAYQQAPPEKYLAEIEKFASGTDRSEKASLRARMHALDYAAEKLSMGRRAALFLQAQQILRHHPENLEDTHKKKLATVLGRSGFHDVAQELSKELKSHAKIMSAFNDPGICSIRFQLEVVPMHLARPKGTPDDRVQFAPDAWQRNLLDIVDSENSALVLAPTASGKTFISYYVMEQCLRINDSDVVVYVAPTKALVNQVRGEISARFSKKYSGAGKLVSVFTRDFRDNNFLDAQILVTVPQCLGILFLTASNSRWTLRIRHIIFDEVHCIGEKGGEIWEQLLLLMEPKMGFLALSATLGNADHFYQWLQKVEEERGRKVFKVVHNERWNHLFPWIWAPQGQALKPRESNLTPLHPAWVLKRLKAMNETISDATFPQDLKLLPEHSVMLYDALLEYLDEASRQHIDPVNFFKGEDCLWNLGMRDVEQWTSSLKTAFFSLSSEKQQTVVNRLSEETEACFEESDACLSTLGEGRYVMREITQLVQELKHRDMLPGICFMLSRRSCERLAIKLTSDFKSREQETRRQPQWVSRRYRLETELQNLRIQYEKSKGGTVVDENGEEIANDKADIRMAWEQTYNKLVQMLQPDPEFCAAKVTEAEIEESFGAAHSWRDFVPPGLVQALFRGIGVHHAGLNLKYRQAVEKLFRRKKLGVVFATTTLAMGINMPSKTSVLIGDAVYLNAMNFRQMAGRAGRRGFDLRGHIVFLGVPSEKCYRLLRSDLPKLQGNLVMDNSLALRIIIKQSSLSSLFADQRAAKMGSRACFRLINYPLFNPLGKRSELMKVQLAHMFRFSVEYLLGLGLLQKVDNRLEPNDLAGFVAHLFFMEPANFAFLALLCDKHGDTLKYICQPGRARREEKVLSILCNIFCRQELPRSVAQWALGDRARTGPSKVVLDPLSKTGEIVHWRDGIPIREGCLVKEILARHNSDALETLSSYTACLVHAYKEELGPDDSLPLTSCKFSNESNQVELSECWRGLLLPSVSVRSSFVALSGNCDQFASIQELCQTSRSGIFLDPRMVPVFELHDEETTSLNSYLLDFYKHGQKEALVRYNKLDVDHVWDQLQSFSLVLKALSAAMERRHQSGLYAGSEIPFDDRDVRETFKNISSRFSQQLRSIAA